MADTESLRELMEAEGLPDTFQAMVDQVHAPLAAWIANRRRAVAGCLVVGVCGPQGSGKTTAALVLRRLLQAGGLRVIILSLDDLYLPRAERLSLAAEVHPLLATRGPPGTHDPELGLAVLQRLRAGEAVATPSFDKALDDRILPSCWPTSEPDADVVLFEGWCVGARPQPQAGLVDPVNALERDEDPDRTWRSFVNAALATYQPLFAELDLLVQFVPPDFEVVARWRMEQEAKLRARQADLPGVMSDHQVARFVAHYERLTRHIIREMPARADALVRLDADRRPLSLTVRAE
jgi:D-glycerate 3-kinase